MVRVHAERTIAAPPERVPAFDHDGGTLTFTPKGDGARVDWVSSYTHPVRAGGMVLHSVSSPLLRANFRAILASCASALEG